jgi:hypothetical protein
MVTKNAANADLRIKSDKPRGTNGSGSPNIITESAGVLQMKGQRPPRGGGSPKMINDPTDILPVKGQRPPRGGGSPKIAAVLNLYGNDCIRQAMQKPDQKLDLINTALLCYEQAVEHDPNDPGLPVNLAIASLLIGDTPGAEGWFLDAFKHCQEDFQKLFALLSLKYDHQKFAEETPLSGVEKILRTTIKNCIEKEGTPTPKPPNQSIFGEGSPTGSPGLTAEEAKEFLYIKTIDSEKA